LLIKGNKNSFVNKVTAAVVEDEVEIVPTRIESRESIDNNDE